MWYLLRRLHRRLRSGWERFWFTPTDPTLVGLLRIATGLVLLYTHAVWGLQLHEFFGSNSWQPPPLVQEMQAGQYQLSYLWWISDDWLMTAHVMAFMVLLAFTCGCLTRITSVLSSVIIISYLRRQPAAGYGLDLINSFLTLYLAFGYLFTPVAARALSFDRFIWMRRQKLRGPTTPLPRSTPANITLRLIQIQMCIVYLFAGLPKLRGDAWWNGDAMWLAFANEEYANPLGMLWTWRFPALLAAAGHVTIFWEVSFAMGVWNRWLRPVYLSFGFMMHAGIGLFLSLWPFALIMMVGCASFTPPDLAARLVARLLGKRPLRADNAPSPAPPSRSDSDVPAVRETDRPAPAEVAPREPVVRHSVRSETGTAEPVADGPTAVTVTSDFETTDIIFGQLGSTGLRRRHPK